MNLQDFRDYIAKFPSDHIFEYGISEPFSWRGIFAEVAFSIEEHPMSRETILERIDMCFEKTFIGYKGGEFKYNGNTEIHFEDNPSEYTNGYYAEKWIDEIQNKKPYISKEEVLINLAFSV